MIEAWTKNLDGTSQLIYFDGVKIAEWSRRLHVYQTTSGMFRAEEAVFERIGNPYTGQNIRVVSVSVTEPLSWSDLTARYPDYRIRPIVALVDPGKGHVGVVYSILIRLLCWLGACKRNQHGDIAW